MSNCTELELESNNDPYILLYIGRCYANLTDYQKADEYLKQSNDVDPNDVYLILQCAEFLEKEMKDYA